LELGAGREGRVDGGAVGLAARCGEGELVALAAGDREGERCGRAPRGRDLGADMGRQLRCERDGDGLRTQLAGEAAEVGQSVEKLHGRELAQVAENGGEQAGEVGLEPRRGEVVDVGLAVFGGGDEPGFAQDFEVMGEGAAGGFGAEVSAAEAPRCGGKLVEDGEAHGVAHRVEQLGEGGGL